MKKRYLIASFFAGWWCSGTLASIVIARQDQRYSRLLKHALLNLEVIKKFAIASPETAHSIRQEMEFDFLVLHLDDIDTKLA